ncbi:YusW family protein [Sporosarcina jeotgali]|uniref:YusW family protein n=1 Tax=Sporosarcina jeotgali TaxID=3020056 RepID=A0ABZ0KYU6_9BACL|nr:YusW family protein [Sporosarcina sp. B2O-1]WOV84581.1 YusW family protein [Sporosarcina sp. B2O-1]
MNKLAAMGSVVFASVLFVNGCGNMGKDANKDNREEADIITNEQKEGGDRDTGDGFGFTKFDLEIDVDNQDAVEAEYEVEKDFEPEFQNKLTNIDLKDEDAMAELDKMFSTINLQHDMSGEEAREKILEYFQIDLYSKFKLDVEFDDGTKMNYEDKQ